MSPWTYSGEQCRAFVYREPYDPQWNHRSDRARFQSHQPAIKGDSWSDSFWPFKATDHINWLIATYIRQISFATDGSSPHRFGIVITAPFPLGPKVKLSLDITYTSHVHIHRIYFLENDCFRDNRITFQSSWIWPSKKKIFICCKKASRLIFGWANKLL